MTVDQAVQDTIKLLGLPETSPTAFAKVFSPRKEVKNLNCVLNSYRIRNENADNKK
jgi:hypothetical protein